MLSKPTTEIYDLRHKLCTLHPSLLVEDLYSNAVCASVERRVHEYPAGVLGAPGRVSAKRRLL